MIHRQTWTPDELMSFPFTVWHDRYRSVLTSVIMNSIYRFDQFCWSNWVWNWVQSTAFEWFTGAMLTLQLVNRSALFILHFLATSYEMSGKYLNIQCIQCLQFNDWPDERQWNAVESLRVRFIREGASKWTSNVRTHRWNTVARSRSISEHLWDSQRVPVKGFLMKGFLMKSALHRADCGTASTVNLAYLRQLIW